MDLYMFLKHSLMWYVLKFLNDHSHPVLLIKPPVFTTSDERFASLWFFMIECMVLNDNKINYTGFMKSISPNRGIWFHTPKQWKTSTQGNMALLNFRYEDNVLSSIPFASLWLFTNVHTSQFASCIVKGHWPAIPWVDWCKSQTVLLWWQWKTVITWMQKCQACTYIVLLTAI
jgi:hypothetical protein